MSDTVALIQKIANLDWKASECEGEVHGEAGIGNVWVEVDRSSGGNTIVTLTHTSSLI